MGKIRVEKKQQTCSACKQKTHNIRTCKKVTNPHLPTTPQKVFPALACETLKVPKREGTGLERKRTFSATQNTNGVVERNKSLTSNLLTNISTVKFNENSKITGETLTLWWNLGKTRRVNIFPWEGSFNVSEEISTFIRYVGEINPEYAKKNQAWKYFFENLSIRDAAAAAASLDIPPFALYYLAQSPHVEVRQETASNWCIDEEGSLILAKDSSEMTRAHLAMNPKSHPQAHIILMVDKSEFVREQLASNTNISDEKLLEMWKKETSPVVKNALRTRAYIRKITQN